jgi:ABC-2 type transport system permease protein
MNDDNPTSEGSPKGDSAVLSSPRHDLSRNTEDYIAPSSLRAWLFLIRLSIQRQARMREMTFIALGLLALAVFLVWILTAADTWNLNSWPPFRRSGSLTFRERTYLLDALIARGASPGEPSVIGMQRGMLAAVRFAMDQSEFFVFSNTVIFWILVGYLLPIWSLSFATQAIANEREESSMIWLLSRPLSRPAIYLAKYLAQLPWSMGMILGGFALMCMMGGRPGALALKLYWPAIFWGTLAYTALFHLFGAIFKRPAIISLIYAFFLEVLMGNMPGYLKRVSINFYVRCMMFDAGKEYAVQPERPWVYLPVDGSTACWVLALTTIGLLGLGMVMFSRSEYVTAD